MALSEHAKQVRRDSITFIGQQSAGKKNVLKTNAPIVKSVIVPGQLDTEIETIRERLQWLRGNNQALWAFMYILFVSGCRVSELLKVKTQEVSKSGTIIIRGLKKSSDRIIDTGEARDFYLAMRTRGGLVFANWSRFYIYREFKKLHIGKIYDNRKRYSVTHYFRHLFVEVNQATEGKLELVSKQIGHKSINSTQHYAKSEERVSSAT